MSGVRPSSRKGRERIARLTRRLEYLRSRPKLNGYAQGEASALAWAIDVLEHVEDGRRVDTFWTLNVSGAQIDGILACLTAGMTAEDFQAGADAFSRGAERFWELRRIAMAATEVAATSQHSFRTAFETLKAAVEQDHTVTRRLERARAWIVAAVDPVQVGTVTKRAMLDYIDGKRGIPDDIHVLMGGKA